jgi:uncharacterized protein (TIGR03067 family)
MNSILPRILVVLATCGNADAGGDAAAGGGGAAKELQSLAGAWKIAAMELDGKAVPKDELPDIAFTLRPDGRAIVRTPDGEFETLSKIDPSQSPKTLDIEYLGGRFKGQMQYAIYKADGDRWTVFATPAGGKPEDRPKTFDSKSAKGAIVVWERVKKE